MKMPKEYVLVLIIGLFLLAYLLEAVVDPLALPLATPYQFFTREYVTKFPFTSALMGIRALAIWLTPLWLFSFIQGGNKYKALALLIIATLVELYSVQATLSTTVGIPLEWTISLALGGIALFIPMIFLFIIPDSKRPIPAKDIGKLEDVNTDEDF